MKTLSILLLFFSMTMLNIAYSAPVASSFTLGGTSPGKWGDPTFGTGANITYSFMLGGETCDLGVCSALNSFMPVGFKTEVEQAFKVWSDVANLTFTEVSDDGANWNSFTTSGDIRIGGESGFASDVLAHGYFPPNNGFTAAGDIHFNDQITWGLDRETFTPFADGFSIFQVMVHELGHALGLGHSDDTSSIMYPSYRVGSAGLLSVDDINGIQFIYGEALTTVAVPAAIWLFGPALIGFIGLRKRRQTSVTA